VIVDNFNTGQFQATLGVAGGFEVHIAAECQTMPGAQAASDKQIGFENQLEFGAQVGSGI